jgi:hypothetical protein
MDRAPSPSGSIIVFYKSKLYLQAHEDADFFIPAHRNEILFWCVEPLDGQAACRLAISHVETRSES